MAQPTIQMEWAGERWTEPEKATFIPKFEISLALAQMGLEEYGLGLENPIVAQLGRYYKEDDYRTLGSCQGPDQFSVWVEDHDIRGGADTYFLRKFAKINIHELTHCLRSLGYSWKRNLREVAATEGIAYSIESTFERELFGRKSCELELLRIYTSDQLKYMHQEFIEDTRGADMDIGSHKQWFKDTGRGCSVGMWCVGKLVNEGATFPEIMEMAPDHILGVAA